MEAHIIKKTDTLDARRYIISSRTKKKHWPKNENRGEVGTSFSFKECDVPWILKKDYLYLARDVILSVETPSLYWSSTLRH